MTRQEQLDELEKLLARLKAANADSPVLVEGERDVAALRDMGLEGTIIKLNLGESLVERADGLSRAYGRIILLTDWDPKGLRLHDRLHELLVDCQVEVEDRHWLRLRRLCGSGCRTIEDVPALVRSLRRMAGRAD